MRRSFLSAALAAGTTIAWEETEWHDNRPHPDIHRPPTRGTTCTSNTLYTQTSWTNTVATTELPESPPGAIQSTVTEVVQETVDVTVTVTAEPHPSSSSCRTLRHNTASQSAHFGSPTPSCSIPQAPLTNEQQVGQSLWGTLCQPNFPKWLPDEHGRRYESAPWGNRSTKDMDGIVNDHVPVTNVSAQSVFGMRYRLTACKGHSKIRFHNLQRAAIRRRCRARRHSRQQSVPGSSHRSKFRRHDRNHCPQQYLFSA